MAAYFHLYTAGKKCQCKKRTDLVFCEVSTFSLSVPSSPACIIDYKAKPLDDVKVHNWS